MRIVFGSFEDFCREVADCAASIRNKTVRVLVTREPEQSEAVTFSCGIIATAVDDKPPEATLLEVAVHTGSDAAATRSKEPGTDGSQNAAMLKDSLLHACEKAGLSLRPGKIELF